MPEALSDIFAMLGISLGLGLLVGLQRQWQEKAVAGIRTFALITLCGTISAMLASSFGGWIVAAALLAVIAVVMINTVLAARSGTFDGGATTEIAAITMFIVGALLVAVSWKIAVALGGVVAVLLQSKPLLHHWVDRLGRKDVRAVMQFALISLVILPVLPDETYGPFDVLNPRSIWWMVVLITGISLSAYVVYKVFGERAGMVLGGLLGGLISSTATTLAFAKRARSSEAMTRSAAVAIMLASTVLFGRVFIEIIIVAPGYAAALLGPIAIMAGAAIIMSIAALLWARNSSVELTEPENPSELKASLMFGGLYAIVLFAVAAAEHFFGEGGIYAVAVLSGLTDMDAITLSSARMVIDEQITPSTAWRAIIIASLSNLAFKVTAASIIAGLRLGRMLGLFLLGSAVTAVAVLVFWPG